MSKPPTRLVALFGLAAFGLACSPTRELVDARAAFNRAATGRANEAAPAKVFEARKALARAERMHDRDPGSDEERDLAYVAQRRAEIAMAYAAMKDARQQRQAAQTAYSETLQSQRDDAVTSLREREREIDQMKGQLESKGEALEQAEERLREELSAAVKSIESASTVKQEQDKTVLSLSGSVVFKLSSDELLPIARDRLNEVAEVLRDHSDGNRIVVEGHTDSTGSDELNERLSQERADAVRQFLVSRGVDPGKIEAVGRGESDPIADNASPEGRANNRRVEIIISKDRMGMR